MPIVLVNRAYGRARARARAAAGGGGGAAAMDGESGRKKNGLAEAASKCTCQSSRAKQESKRSRGSDTLEATTTTRGDTPLGSPRTNRTGLRGSRRAQGICTRGEEVLAISTFRFAGETLDSIHIYSIHDPGPPFPRLVTHQKSKSRDHTQCTTTLHKVFEPSAV